MEMNGGSKEAGRERGVSWWMRESRRLAGRERMRAA
jgi:hypothetical protein